MHQDCCYLLRQLELVYRSNELLLGAQQYSDEARAALGAELEAAEKRIAELEAQVAELTAALQIVKTLIQGGEDE